MFNIIEDFGRRLEALLDNCSSDSEEINLRISLSAFDPGKGSSGSRPPVFNDIKIFAEGTAPGLAKSFLVTKDFIEFANNESVEAIFSLSVKSVLNVDFVPQIIPAESVVAGM